MEKTEHDLYVAYNDTYRAYLNNVHPMIFMNNFLEKIIKLTNSTIGYVLSVHNVNNEKLINMEAFYKDKIYDDTIIYQNPTTTINNNSFCMKSIISGEIYIINSISNVDVHNEPIKCFGHQSCYICIPYKFNDTVIGVLGLFGISDYSDKLKDLYKLIGTLIANLQNNYFKLRLSNTYDDRKSIIYQLMDDMLNTIRDGILIIDTTFDIMYENRYAKYLFSELSNTKITNILHFSQLQNITNEHTSQKIFKNRKINFTVQSKNVTFIFNTVICFGMFFHLVTIHYYEKPDESMTNNCLMAYLSHELRNPLQSIILANHLIKTNVTACTLSQKILTHFGTINNCCHNMKKIINDILDLTRIDANELVIDLEYCDTLDIIHAVVDEHTYDATEKNINIVVSIGETTMLYTDSTRLHQILSNIVSNAIKYSTSGNVTISTAYDVHTNEILFGISDDGQGMSQHDINNLFTPYCQNLHNKNKSNSQGLGLCISQKLAQLLGGNIHVSSELNKGSIFTLRHPAKLGINKINTDVVFCYDYLTGNILLVDDNYSNLSLLHLMLDQFNREFMWTITIDSTDTGKQAIELSTLNKYDIIFMDINMSEMDGIMTSNIIKSNGTFNGYIVATTGNILSKQENRNPNVTDIYKCFDDIIIKPFDDVILLKILRKLLNEKFKNNS